MLIALQLYDSLNQCQRRLCCWRSRWQWKWATLCCIPAFPQQIKVLVNYFR